VRLRTQILIFLLLFGLAPLLATLVITVPLVVNSLELFYHKAHLQNLRADFRDLDQHIASRMEMVRLLAKLPEGELLVQDPSQVDPAARASLESHYADAINRILYDQDDIVQVLFLDRAGTAQHWLERDARSGRLVPESAMLDRPGHGFVEAGLRLEPGGVLISPVSVNPEAGARDPKRFMVLRLISPLTTVAAAQASAERPGGAAGGAVVINIDVGGLAEAYPKTYWVLDDGRFLRYGGTEGAEAAAFKQFPGLEEIFRKGELGLWKGPDQAQVIWVPLLATERSGPLWVGRQVDASPLTQFLDALQVRTGAVVIPLMALILGLAHWLAGRAERMGRELTDGISQLLRADQPVHFGWRGPRELQALAQDLTRLSAAHAANVQALREHTRALEESNRYKSEFLANVSHELRTPLNSILLLSKLLAEHRAPCLSHEQVRQARVIHEAGRDLAALIDNILDLARIEARRTSLNLETADLEPVLSALIELVQPQAQAKGLALELQVAEDAPRRLTTDVDKLRQVLKNFLGNAVKFTERGQVRLLLARNTGPDAAERPVRLAVADTGIGIPADKHEVIFEAFQQADGSTSRRFGGSGLGLAISRGLAERLGGRIELASEPGGGSVFALLLPVEPRPGQPGDAGPAERVGPARSEAPPLPSADFGGRRVLLVDNDVRNLIALTPLLERWGLDVVAAGDADEALEVLQEDDRIDLVLTDVMLPGADGDDTIRRIRAQAGFAELPILALTARTEDEARARTLAAGAQDVLCKPVDPSRLLDRLMQYLAPELKTTSASEGVA
jgi:signal transduction histidine kinase/ActR/RegA family two-component response regulator